MKVLLNRCDNDIEYVVDCYDDIIGFNEDYRDSEGNLYRLYFKTILDTREVKEMIEEDCWERVCAWEKPTYIEFYCGEDEGEIARKILKKLKSKYIPSGSDLLDIGCTVKAVGNGFIIDI